MCVFERERDRERMSVCVCVCVYSIYLIIFIYLFTHPGSKSQSALWNAITAGMGIKGKEQKSLLNDPRSLEEILAEDLPLADEPDATEKTAIRFACGRFFSRSVVFGPISIFFFPPMFK